MALIAASMSEYAVSSTRRAIGYTSRDRASTSPPSIPGMRWSLMSIASESPRLFSSRAVVERLLPRRRAHDRVLLPVPGAQVAPHRREHLRVVVHDQENGLVHDRPSEPSAIGSVTRNSVRPGCDSTSISPSLCSDQTPDDVEAEPGALPHRLGREERIEDPVADLGGNAGSVVDDPHDDLVVLAAGRARRRGPPRGPRRARCRSGSPRSGSARRRTRGRAADPAPS